MSLKDFSRINVVNPGVLRRGANTDGYGYMVDCAFHLRCKMKWKVKAVAQGYLICLWGQGVRFTCGRVVRYVRRRRKRRKWLTALSESSPIGFYGRNIDTRIIVAFTLLQSTWSSLFTPLPCVFLLLHSVSIPRLPNIPSSSVRRLPKLDLISFGILNMARDQSSLRYLTLLQLLS